MAMPLGALLPAVPAVEPLAPAVEPVEPAPAVDPVPLVAPPLLLPGDVVEPGALPVAPVLPMADAGAIRALVSMKLPLPIMRGMLDGEPVVPLVPVAPGVLPLP